MKTELTFTMLRWKWPSGEPQQVISCDHCRCNMSFGPYGTLEDVFRWAVTHKCAQVTMKVSLPMKEQVSEELLDKKE